MEIGLVKRKEIKPDSATLYRVSKKRKGKD
jgi:hypothetical protein